MRAYNPSRFSKCIHSECTSHAIFIDCRCGVRRDAFAGYVDDSVNWPVQQQAVGLIATLAGDLMDRIGAPLQGMANALRKYVYGASVRIACEVGVTRARWSIMCRRVV